PQRRGRRGAHLLSGGWPHRGTAAAAARLSLLVTHVRTAAAAARGRVQADRPRLPRVRPVGGAAAGGLLLQPARPRVPGAAAALSGPQEGWASKAWPVTPALAGPSSAM